MRYKGGNSSGKSIDCCKETPAVCRHLCENPLHSLRTAVIVGDMNRICIICCIIR